MSNSDNVRFCFVRSLDQEGPYLDDSKVSTLNIDQHQPSYQVSNGGDIDHFIITIILLFLENRDKNASVTINRYKRKSSFPKTAEVM